MAHEGKSPNVRVHFEGQDGELYFKDMRFESAVKRSEPDHPIDTAWIEYDEFWGALPLHHDTVIGTEFLEPYKAVFHDGTSVIFGAANPVDAGNYCNFKGWEYKFLLKLTGFDSMYIARIKHISQ